MEKYNGSWWFNRDANMSTSGFPKMANSFLKTDLSNCHSVLSLKCLCHEISFLRFLTSV